MPDTYRSFKDLEASEREGENWAREYLPRGSRILVMAPHGGWIEPLTTELARGVAGDTFSFYTFQGTKPKGNHHLHLTSHRFDEPLALKATDEAEAVLCLHGERSRHRAFVMVGGLWGRLRVDLLRELTSAGFSAEGPRPGLTGRHTKNICNRGRLGAGGQLEISEGLRVLLQADPELRDHFASAVRGVLLSWEETPVWVEPGSGPSDGEAST